MAAADYQEPMYALANRGPVWVSSVTGCVLHAKFRYGDSHGGKRKYTETQSPLCAVHSDSKYRAAAGLRYRRFKHEMTWFAVLYIGINDKLNLFHDLQGYIMK